MFKYKNTEGELNIPKIVIHAFIGLVVVVAGLNIVFGSFGTVGAGQRGVLLRFGATTGRVIEPGLYFKTPFIDHVVKIDVQTQVENVDATAASKDLQDVSTSVGLNYSVNTSEVNKLYSDIGTEYKNKIIDPAIQDAVKAATASFTAEELITKREEVKDKIVSVLKEKFVGQHLNIISLNITNFKFSTSFEQAIEAKVTAEQDALAAKNKLAQVNYEAEQRVSQAKGEAEAIRIQAQAIQAQGGAEYVKLKWVEAWEKGGAKVPQVVSGNGGGFLLNLNLAQ